MASSKQHRRMRARIAALKADERRQLYKRAANMRRASQQKRSKPKHRRDYEALGDENESAGFEKRRRRYKGSLRQWAEALLDDDSVAATAEIAGVDEPTTEGPLLTLPGCTVEDWGQGTTEGAGRCRYAMISNVKPPREITRGLRSLGLRWMRSESAWVAYRNPRGRHAIEAGARIYSEWFQNR